MKAKVEIEFKDLPIEKIQNTLLEILHALKAEDMIENGSFEIFSSTGVVTEKCIVQENKVVA
ncbi:hypothetical protein [Thermodesulfovibrio hydrogeniphilus]